MTDTAALRAAALAATPAWADQNGVPQIVASAPTILALLDRVERLEAALESIAKAHHSDPDGGMGYRDDGHYGSVDSACIVCGTSEEYAVKWPCWTHEEARAALAAREEPK